VNQLTLSFFRSIQRPAGSHAWNPEQHVSWGGHLPSETDTAHLFFHVTPK